MVQTLCRPETIVEPPYDDSLTDEQIYQCALNDGLTEAEIEEAIKLYPLTRGLGIVCGMPGSGKDLFSNVFTWKAKRYYKNKKIHRDEMPRRLFGPYIPFNEQTLREDLIRMKGLAKSQDGVTPDIPTEIARGNKADLSKAETVAAAWAKTKEVQLLNSILYLTEFWRYMHNRNPHNPMGITIGGLIKTWRHYDLLILGTVQQKRELDAISCLPYVTFEVRCQWTSRNVGQYRVFPVRYVGTKGVLETAGKSIPFVIDGNRPRDILGGKRYYDLYNSKSNVIIPVTRKIDM